MYCVVSFENFIFRAVKASFKIFQKEPQEFFYFNIPYVTFLSVNLNSYKKLYNITNAYLKAQNTHENKNAMPGTNIFSFFVKK